MRAAAVAAFVAAHSVAALATLRRDDGEPMTGAALLVDDASLRAAIVFALEAEGHRVDVCEDLDRLIGAGDDRRCLIIDLPRHESHRLGRLGELSRGSPDALVIVLATCPSARVRAAVAAMGATLIEKPLVNDTLRDAVDVAERHVAPERRSAGQARR